MPWAQGAVLIALVALVACTTTVAVSGRFPARYPEAAEMRKIAVAHFYGRGSDEFTAAMEGALFAADFDGAKYFTLVGSGSSPFSQDATHQASFGRSVGAQGVLFGQTDIFTENNRYDGTRSVCVTYEGKKCTKYVNETVKCLRRTMNMTASPKIVKSSGAGIAYSADKRASAETSWCGGDAQPITDDAMIANLRAQIVADIRRDIAPYNDVMTATLKRDGKTLPEEQQPQFDLALKAAGAGNMIGACEIWRTIAVASPSHIGTAFNLGVCLESSGNFPGAIDQYRRVLAWAPADRMIVEAIDRATTLADANRAVGRSGGRR